MGRPSLRDRSNVSRGPVTGPAKAGEVCVIAGFWILIASTIVHLLEGVPALLLEGLLYLLPFAVVGVCAFIAIFLVAVVVDLLR